jgi:hypothetical protein
MLNTLFWISLIATLVMAWRSRSQWDGYHRADVTRTALTNQITLTIGLAVLTVVLLVAKGFIRI